VRPEGVLFAKNSDRDANEAQLLEWHPRREGSPGSRLRCTWIEIEETPLRHAVLLSRPFWTWGAEMGANEHGLVVGNVAVFTRERVGPPGLTGMDLVRLCLERAADAEEGARVLAALIETHGQGGGCGHENRRFTYHNSFMLADPRRALLVETAGKAIAVEQVTGAVRWRECVAWIASQGVLKFVECGSGKVLAGLLKRIAPGATGISVGGPADLDAYRAF